MTTETINHFPSYWTNRADLIPDDFQAHVDKARMDLALTGMAIVELIVPSQATRYDLLIAELDEDEMVVVDLETRKASGRLSRDWRGSRYYSQRLVSSDWNLVTAETVGYLLALTQEKRDHDAA